MSIKCWVVMGNDYPAGVFASEASADEFIRFKKWWHLIQPDYQRSHIHWRHYEFTLETEYVPDTLQPGHGKKIKEMTSEELKREWWYWSSREFGRTGAAWSAANEFRRDVESELHIRHADVESMRSNYLSITGNRKE